MSTTQIPPKDPALVRRPAPPPPPPRPSGGEIYDRNHWESAYRNSQVFDAPKLLIQMQDELARSRQREALWISVLVHIVLGVVIWFAPAFLRIFLRPHTLQSTDWMQQKDATYIELPPDAEHITERPKTNIISDKDRIATRSQQPDPNELKKLREMAKRGAPAPEPKQEAALQNAPGPQAPSAPPQDVPKMPPQLVQAPPPPVSPKVLFGGTVSASSAVEQAARAAAASHGGYEGQSDGGYHRGQASTASGLQVLSDTMGVDFDPYLKRVLHDVRVHWYELIPESAMPPISKQGKLSIQFAILKDGRVSAMQLADSSNDVALDRAAWGGINGSNPFPPLPADFKGEYLMLRFTFYYNPPEGALLR